MARRKPNHKNLQEFALTRRELGQAVIDWLVRHRGVERDKLYGMDMSGAEGTAITIRLWEVDE
jgi:hypothetical protein